LHPSQKADHKTVLEEQGLKRDECTAGTRLKILEDIIDWANDRSSGSPHVFWLTGQAGSGKTTIAYTVAKRFEEGVHTNQQHTVFGANFFCSRQFQETQVQTRILPTIVYQLARKCRSYANALHVADRFDAVNHEVTTQMKDLLVRPWQQSEVSRPPELPPYLIVIDALDEIKDDKGPAFLRHLLTVIKEYDLRGFKFLVTSRSDPRIDKLAFKAICRLQDVPIGQAKSDIETYLKTKLPMLAGSPQLTELGLRAGGLFIYAATAVKYLTRRASIKSREQTEMLEELLAKSYEPASARKATFLIDELYRQIMHDAFSDLEGRFLTRRLRILYTVLCMAERTPTSVVAALLAEDDEVTRAVAEDLHAVLYIQDDRIFWYHASFPDFIFDPARSNFLLGEGEFAFSCNGPAHHNLLGESCFRVMKSGLRFNMGDIPSSFLFDKDDADALSEKVNKNISAVLKYSCRHWTHHLPLLQGIDTNILCCCISDFLQISVLFWIEVMNLLGLRSQCTPMLQLTHQWLSKVRICTVLVVVQQLMLSVSAGTVIRNWRMMLVKQPILLRISLGAQLLHQHHICTSQHWQHGRTSLCRNWKKQFSRIPIFTHSTKGSVDLPLMTVPAEDVISAVAFSNNGTQIVSGSWDCSVRVWDASTGAELNVLNGHNHLVSSVAFSSDDTQIVSGSYDRTVRVWDALTGAELKVLKGHTGEVNSVAISSDGKEIVSSSDDCSVRLWDASTGAELKVLEGHTSDVKSVAFSSNGKQIMSGSKDDSVRLWDVSTGDELKVLRGHAGSIKSVAFSTDGKQIVSGSAVDNSVRVWDVLTGAELHVLKGHTYSVISVAFSSDGKQIMSGSLDNSVRLWDSSTGAELKVLNGHTSAVKSVAYPTFGKRIVSGSMDKSLRVWDASICAELQELKVHTSGILSVAFSSDGKKLVSGSQDGSVQVWDASTGTELKVMKGHTDLVYSVAFSSDSMQIVSGSRDNSVRVWDVLTGAELHVLKDHTSAIRSVALSSDGQWIVFGSHNLVRMWDALTGAELKVLEGHMRVVSSVVVSSDGKQIASGSWDGSVRVWDALTGAELKVLEGHTDSVNSVAFSSNDKQIVSGSWDNSVRVWDALTGAELKVLNGHTGSVSSVACSGDGKWIVSGSVDDSVRVWDAETGDELRVLKGHTGHVTSVAFSSDGTRIVSGSVDESVRVWDMSGYEDWNLVETTWIISGQDHRMWVPQGTQLTTQSNILIISHNGFGSVDFKQSMIGVEWVGSYTPTL
jgi:WD40 repeat protein